jgi:hypothetical protein
MTDNAVESRQIEGDVRAPTPEQVADTLQMMVGRSVIVTDAGWAPPEGTDPVAIGSYVDDDQVLRACAWLDLPAAAALGAAMGMLPQVRLQEMLDTGELDDEVFDNLHETLNIASSMLNSDSSMHLRVRELERPEQGVSEDVLELLGEPRAAGYYHIEVAEYGSGVMSFTLG